MREGERTLLVFLCQFQWGLFSRDALNSDGWGITPKWPGLSQRHSAMHYVTWVHCDERGSESPLFWWLLGVWCSQVHLPSGNSRMGPQAQSYHRSLYICQQTPEHSTTPMANFEQNDPKFRPAISATGPSRSCQPKVRDTAGLSCQTQTELLREGAWTGFGLSTEKGLKAFLSMHIQAHHQEWASPKPPHSFESFLVLEPWAGIPHTFRSVATRPARTKLIRKRSPGMEWLGASNFTIVCGVCWIVVGAESTAIEIGGVGK